MSRLQGETSGEWFTQGVTRIVLLILGVLGVLGLGVLGVREMTKIKTEKAIKMMLGMKAGGGEIGTAVIVKNGIVERQMDSMIVSFVVSFYCISIYLYYCKFN